MIDVKHRYALLENGTIEPLHYSDGTLRDVYQDWDGLWYMDHEVRGTYTGAGVLHSGMIGYYQRPTTSLYWR